MPQKRDGFIRRQNEFSSTRDEFFLSIIVDFIIFFRVFRRFALRLNINGIILWISGLYLTRVYINFVSFFVSKIKQNRFSRNDQCYDDLSLYLGVVIVSVWYNGLVSAPILRVIGSYSYLGDVLCDICIFFAACTPVSWCCHL